MNQAPIIRQIAWISLVPQLLVVGLIAISIKAFIHVRMSAAILIASLIFTLLSMTIRFIIARPHREGMKRVKAGDFAEAIPYFEESYDYFSKHKWIDQWRFLLFGSSGKCSYREMALVNIAFCYSQVGEGGTTKAYYERALEEFPQSTMARAGLNMARSFQEAEA